MVHMKYSGANPSNKLKNKSKKKFSMSKAYRGKTLYGVTGYKPNGKRECRRRVRQIATGRLLHANGLINSVHDMKEWGN